MTDILLGSLLPVFFVLALGYIAGKTGKIDNVHVASLNTLVMDITLPAALFVAMVRAPRAELLNQAGLFGVFAASMLLIFGGGLLILSRFRDLSRGERVLQAVTFAVPNTGSAGIPVMASVFHQPAAVAVATHIVAATVIVIPLGMFMLEASRSGPRRGKPQILMQLYTKPVVLAPLAGVLISMAGVSLPLVVDHSIMLIGQATAGIALFLTGLVVSAQRFSFSGDVAVGVVLKNIVHPAVTALLAIPLLPAETARIAVVLMAIPASFFGVLLAITYEVPTKSIGTLLVVSTMLSAVTLAAAIVLTSGW